MILRQDKMTSQERVDALFSGQRPDRVPLGMITVGFPARNAGLSITDAYAKPDKFFAAAQWTAEQFGWDPFPQTARHTVTAATDLGGRVRLPAGEFDGALIIEKHPISSPEEVENVQVPDPLSVPDVALSLEFAKLQEAAGVPVSFITRSPLTMAGNICGLDNFCRWMLKAPEACFRLMDIALEHIGNVLTLWVETFGPERLMAFMSSPSESNQVISPKWFEKFALPYHEKFHAKLAELGVKRFCFHICGEQNKNLPMLSELSCWTHPSVMSIGHEVDIEVAAQAFPQDIIYGNVEPAIIQMGSPQQVYELSREAIAKGKDLPGGFVLSAGCELPPNAPSANLYAMTKAVNDLGWY